MAPSTNVRRGTGEERKGTRVDRRERHRTPQYRELAKNVWSEERKAGVQSKRRRTHDRRNKFVGNESHFSNSNPTPASGAKNREAIKSQVPKTQQSHACRMAFERHIHLLSTERANFQKPGNCWVQNHAPGITQLRYDYSEEAFPYIGVEINYNDKNYYYSDEATEE